MNRKMTSSKLLAALLLTSGLALAGCATKPKQLPPQPTGATGTTTTNPPAPQPMGPMPGSQADFIASVLSDTILFDTDRYNLDSGSVNATTSAARQSPRNRISSTITSTTASISDFDTVWMARPTRSPTWRWCSSCTCSWA